MKRYIILTILLVFTGVCYCQVDPNDIDWSWDTLIDIYNAGGYGNYVTGNNNGIGSSTHNGYIEMPFYFGDSDLVFRMEIPEEWQYTCEFKDQLGNKAQSLLTMPYEQLPETAALYTITCSENSEDGGVVAVFNAYTRFKGNPTDSSNINRGIGYDSYAGTLSVNTPDEAYFIKYDIMNFKVGNKKYEDMINHIISSMHWDQRKSNE